MLHRLTTLTVPKLAAGCACLSEVLADPGLAPARASCLRTLYPEPAHLLAIARALPPG
jgi:hypothetical protein